MSLIDLLGALAVVLGLLLLFGTLYVFRQFFRSL